MVEVAEKVCSVCGDVKPPADFYIDEMTQDILYKFCKSCWVLHGRRGTKKDSAENTHEFCPRCEEIKTTSNFSKNKWSRNGLHTYCKLCCSKRITNADRRRVCNNYAKKRYGITGDYWIKLRQQPCEICGRVLESKLMHIDHTIDGSYHGVLCTHCNTGIGHFQHNVEIIRLAEAYVIRTRCSDISVLNELAEAA